MERAEIVQDNTLLRPMRRSGRPFWIFTSTLLAIGLWGVFAWTTQLRPRNGAAPSRGRRR